MGVVDGFDDLIVRHSEERFPPDEYEAHAGSEAVEAGRVVVGVVLDEADRLLLIDESWAAGWKSPAGAPKADESLESALVREVREETGVIVSPVRPHAVERQTLIDATSPRTAGFEAVFFEASAESTDVGDSLGVADEEIRAARWFDGPPGELFHPLTETIYRRCVDAVDGR